MQKTLNPVLARLRCPTPADNVNNLAEECGCGTVLFNKWISTFYVNAKIVAVVGLALETGGLSAVDNPARKNYSLNSRMPSCSTEFTEDHLYSQLTSSCLLVNGCSQRV